MTQLQTQDSYFFLKKKKKPNNPTFLRGSKYLMNRPCNSHPSYPRGRGRVPFPLVADFSHSSHTHWRSLPSTHRVLSQLLASLPQRNALPATSNPSRVLASQICTLSLQAFCLMDATLQEPLGKPQQGGSEGTGGCLLHWHFALLLIDFYPLSHFLVILYFVLRKIKAPKNVPQMHSIPMEDSRGEQSPGGAVYRVASEMVNSMPVSSVEE